MVDAFEGTNAAEYTADGTTKKRRRKSNLFDVDLPDVEEHVKPARADRRVVDAQDDLVAARLGRPPRVRPQAPGERRLGQRAAVDAGPRTARSKPDRERVGRRRAAPDDAGDPVLGTAAGDP